MDFQEILDIQQKLQEDKFPKILLLSPETQILLHTNALVHEIIETERELNYKYWKTPIPVDWDKVYNELVDQFIFFMNELNAAGFTAENLFKRTVYKQGVNRDRQKAGY